jgi:hypothetical protein
VTGAGGVLSMVQSFKAVEIARRFNADGEGWAPLTQSTTPVPAPTAARGTLWTSGQPGAGQTPSGPSLTGQPASGQNATNQPATGPSPTSHVPRGQSSLAATLAAQLESGQSATAPKGANPAGTAHAGTGASGVADAQTSGRAAGTLPSHGAALPQSLSSAVPMAEAVRAPGTTAVSLAMLTQPRLMSTAPPLVPRQGADLSSGRQGSSAAGTSGGSVKSSAPDGMQARTGPAASASDQSGSVTGAHRGASGGAVSAPKVGQECSFVRTVDGSTAGRMAAQDSMASSRTPDTAAGQSLTSAPATVAAATLGPTAASMSLGMPADAAAGKPPATAAQISVGAGSATAATQGAPTSGLSAGATPSATALPGIQHVDLPGATAATAAAARGESADGARRGDTGAMGRADGAAVSGAADMSGPRGTGPSGAAPTAVTQALGVLLAEATAAGTSAQSTGTDVRAAASLIIYNAAMLPGWPYATAFAKDGPAQDAKAALQQLGAALNKMSPEEMADYLARVGANYGLIDLIRKGLSRDIDQQKQKLLGFLAVLARAVGDVMNSLKTSVALSADEMAALDAARAGGSEHHGRRHLPL